MSLIAAIGLSATGCFTQVADPGLAEVSGIAESRVTPGVFWAHNDSGGAASIYSFDLKGVSHGTVPVSNATNVDWEDMAVGPNPSATGTSVYVGDIGDNNAVRSSVAVYRIDEAALTSAAATGGTVTADTLTFTYPDGPRDAESLFIDPVDRKIVIIEKTYTANPVGVYTAPLDLANGSTGVLTKIGTINLGGGLANAATAADATADGRTIAIRTYGTVRMYPRTPGMSLITALQATNSVSQQPPSEVQGESIALRRGLPTPAYVTVPEGPNPIISTFG